MLCYIGTFQLVPLLAIMLVVIGLALVSFVTGAVASRWLTSEAAPWGSFGLLALGLIPLELWLRRRTRRAVARRPVPLHGLLHGAGDVSDLVGGKAAGLVRAARAGLPVPPAMALSAPACRALGRGRAAFTRSIRKQLGREGIETAIVRSSFVGEDGSSLHAGAYRSVRDVPLRDAGALAHAIDEVISSIGSPEAAAYRALRNAPEVQPAVLVQAQLTGTIGIASSRPPDGRSDVVVVETDATPTMVDLVSGTARLAGGAASTPTWMTELASILLILEQELGGPVQVEFALVDHALSILQVRRAPAGGSRRCFVNDGPIAFERTPRPEALWALRGGVESLRESIERAGRLVRPGFEVPTDSVRIVDGCAYLDMEVWRTLMGSPRDWGAALRQLATLLGSVPEPPVIQAPGSTEEGAWGEWARAYLRPLHRAQMAVTIRQVLAAQLADALRRDAAGVPGLHLVANAAQRLSARLRVRRDRIHAALARAEAAAMETLQIEIMDGPVAPVRRHEPALAPATPDPTRLGAATVCAGRVEGKLARPTSPTDPADSVLVLPNGDPRWYPLLEHATGIILAGGGLLSHLATTAAELGIPTVLCLDPTLESWPDGTVVRLDATLGVLKRSV